MNAQCTPLELATLTASDAETGDSLGLSVAISGDTAVAGAPFDDHDGGTDAGSAYVFVRASDTWVEQAKLTASDAGPDDEFGSSIAISGDTVVVGAKLGFGSAGLYLSGTAYVFERSGNVWIEEAQLTPSDAAVGDRFAYSVAVSGDTIVVGAFGGNNAVGLQTGSAYVFTRSGGQWIEQAELTASDGEEFDSFGRSVSIAGDTILIGASDDQHPGESQRGSAYVFIHSGGIWAQQAKLVASNSEYWNSFGFAVSVSADTAVVGAPYSSPPSKFNAGSAYAFGRERGSWAQQAVLTASDSAEFDCFGFAVDIDGTAVVVGAPTKNYRGLEVAGSAYVFAPSPEGWTERGVLRRSDAISYTESGYAVAVSGDIAVTGAFLDSHASQFHAGSASVFELNLTGSGDLNGDGAINSADTVVLVHVLLGLDANPLHIARADIDCSGVPDGSDIQPFVNILLD